MKRMNSGTAIALIFGLAAATQSWTGARGQGVPVSNAPPVVAGNSNTRIDVTSSGTPIVNIATPREDGTSYNVFSKLNVGKEGLIFNNSAAIGRSQIGGQILANSRLKNSGSASLILNEVTGGTRSDLRGAIEVFGGKAALVIANPSGITCDGCGFINISRAALSTGRITFGSDSEFSGFSVSGGDVRIQGQGLLAGNVDFFDIVTGSAIINANLFARDLVISGGNADFDFASRTATARAGGNDRLAIDSSLLGGMYANRIRLIGTGKGVGINLQGLVNALEGPLAINAEGAITVKTAAAASDVSIMSTGSNVNVDERVYGAGATKIDAAGNIVLAGDFVGAANGVSLSSGADIILNGSGLFAGLSSAGRLDSAGTLAIKAAGQVTAGALRAIATEGLNLSADTATLSRASNFSARDISVKISKGLISDGAIEATGGLALSGDTLRIGGDLVANAALAIDGRNIALSGRAIGVFGLGVRAADRLDIGGEADLQSNGLANLAGRSVDNAGRVVGMGGVSVEAANALANSGALLSGADANIRSGGDATLGGVINANGKTNVAVGGNANVTGAVAAAGDVDMRAAALSLDGMVSSGANLTAIASDAITLGTTSLIAADGDVALGARAISASGTISSGDQLDLASANTLALRGQIQSGGNIAARGSDVTFGGVTVSDRDIAIVGIGALNVSGAVSAAGTLVANAGGITTATGAQLVAGDALRLMSAGDLTNAGFASGKTGTLSAGGALTNTGALFGESALVLNAATRVNQSGSAESGGSLAVATDAITLSGRTLGMSGVSATANTIITSGDLQSGGTLALDARGALNTAGNILSVGDFTANSAADFVQAADITLGKGAVLAAVGSLTQNGVIEAAGNIDLSGRSVSGSGALMSDARVVVRALAAGIDLTGDISAKSSILLASSDMLNLRGNVATDGVIDIAASDLTIAGDVVAGGGFLTNLTGGLAVTATGQLRSGVGLALDVRDVDNRGLIAAVGPLTLATRANLINSGIVLSDRAGTLRIGGDLSNSGVVQAGGALTGTIAGTAGVDGRLSSAGALTLNANAIAVSGSVETGRALDLTAASTIQTGPNALLASGSDLALSGGGSVSLDGQIDAVGALSARTNGLLTIDGVLQSGGAASVAGNAVMINGQLIADGTATLSADTRLDLNGIASGLAGASVNAGEIRLGADSQLLSNGAIAVASQSNLLAQGQVVGRNTVDLTAVGALANDGLLRSGEALRLSGAALTLGRAAQIGSDASINLNSSGALTAERGSTLSAATDFLLSAGSDISLAGESLSGGATRVNADDGLISSGVLQALGDIALDGKAVSLAGTLATNANLAVNAGQLETSATINAAQRASFASATTLNAGGAISAGTSLTLTATDALNQSGTLDTAGKLSLSGGATTLANRAIGVAGVKVTGASISTTDAADVQSGATLDLVSRGDIGVGGAVSAAGDLTLNAGGALRQGGTIVTGADASLTAATTLTNAGRIDASGSARLSGAVLLSSGRIVTGVDLALTSTQGDMTLGGTISSARNLQLGSAGNLRLDGVAAAGGTLGLNVAGALDLGIGGQLLADNDQTLSVANAITNLGAISTSGSLSINSARFNSLGTIQTARSFALSADQLSVSGRILSGGDLSLRSTAGALDLDASLDAGNIMLAAAGGDLNVANGVVIAATQTATLSSDQNLRFGGALTANTGITVGAGSGLAAFGADSILQTSGSLSVAADAATLDGLLFANDRLAIDARTVALTGRATGLAGLAVRATQSLSTSAMLQSGGSALLRSGGDAVINGLIAAADDLSLSGNNIALDGMVSSGGALRLEASGQFAATAGSNVIADGAGRIVAGALDAQGYISSGGALDLSSAAALSLSGQTHAGGSLSANAATLTLGGTTVSDVDIALTTSGAARVTGAASARGNIITTSDTLSVANAAQLVAGGSLALTSAQQIENAGTLSSDRATLAAGAAIANTGTLVTKGDLGLNAATAINQAGTAEAGGVARFAADALTLSGKTLGSGGVAATARDINLSAASDLQSGNTLTLDAAQTLTTAGKITSVDTLTATSGGDTIQAANIILGKGATFAAIGSFAQNGLIQAAGPLELSGRDVRGSGGLLSDASVAVRAVAGGIDLTGDISGLTGLRFAASSDIALGGTVATDGVIALTAANLTLAGDTVAAVGFLTNISDVLTITTSGALRSGTGLALSTRAINNAGTIASVGGLRLSTAQDLNNQGRIVTNDALTLTIGRDLISSGTVSAIGALRADIGGAASLSGSVSSNDALDLAANRIALGGDVVAGGTLDLTSVTDVAITNGAQVSAQQAANLIAGQALSNSGTVISNRDLTLDAGGALSNSNIIQSGGALTLSGASLGLAGDVAAVGTLTATTAGDFTAAGRLSANQAIRLSAGTFNTNAASQIIGGSDIGVNVSGAVTLRGGLESARALAVNGARIDGANGSSLIGGGALNLTSQNGLTLDGNVQSGGASVLNAQGGFALAGTLSSVGAIDLTSGSVAIDGTAQSNSLINILSQIGDVRIGGTVQGAGDVGIDAKSALILGGSTQADAALTLKGASATISGGAIGVDALEITVTGAFSSGAASQLLSNGAVSLRSGDATIGNGIEAGGNLGITATGLLSASGTLFSGQALSFDLGALDLIGTVQSTGAGIVKTLGRLGINANANLLSGGVLTLDSKGDIANSGAVASVGALTFAALGTLTTTGQVDSSGAIGLSARALALGGEIASDMGLNAQASEALTLSGTVSARGVVGFDAQSIAVTNLGSLQTRSNARLTASGDVTNEGLVFANGQIAIDGRDIGISGSVTGLTGVTATGRNVSVAATGDVQSGASLALAAREALVQNGNVLAVDALSLASGTTLDLNGTTESGGAAALRAGTVLTTTNDLLAGGAIAVDAGTANLRGALSSGSSIGVRASDISGRAAITASGRVDLAATGALDLAPTAQLESGAGVGLSGAAVTANAAIRATGAIRVDATTSLAIGGTVEATGNIQLSSRGTLTSNASILTLGDAVLSGGNSDIIGNIASIGAISVNGAALRVRGQLDAGGALDLIAANDLTTDAAAALSAGTTFGISARGNATLGGLIEANRALTVAADGDLTILGNALGLDAVTLGGRAISIEGSAQSAKLLTLNAATLLRSNGLVTGVDGVSASAGEIQLGAASLLLSDQAVALNARGALSNLGEVSALGTLSLDAGGRLNNDGLLSAGDNVRISGAGIALGQNSVIAASKALTGTSSADFATAGTIDAVNAVDLSATGNFVQDAVLTATGNIGLRAGGAFTGSGVVSTSELLTLTAGSIDSASALTADKQVTISSTSGDIILGGAVSSIAGIAINSARDLTLRQNIITDGLLTASGRDISIAGMTIGRAATALSAGRALTLGANALVSSNDRIDLSGVDLTNDGIISSLNRIDGGFSGALVNRGLITTDGALGLRSATLTNLSGAELSADAVTLFSTGATLLGGVVLADSLLDLRAVSLDVSGTIRSVSAIDVDVSGPLALAAGSALVSDSGIALRSNAGLTANGTIFSNGATALVAGGALDLGGSLQSVGAVTLRGAVLGLGGTLVTDDALSAITAGALTLSGQYQAERAIILGGGVTRFGAGSTLTSNDAITLSATSLDSAAEINARGAIVVGSAGDLFTRRTISAGGPLTLTAGGILVQDGVLDTARRLTLSGGAVTLGNLAIGVEGIAVDGGSIVTTTIADIESGRALSLTSRGALTLGGSLSATTDFDASAAGDIVQGGTIFSNGASTLSAGGRFTNSGIVEAAGTLSLDGSDFTTSGRLISDAGLTIRNEGGAASFGGVISGATGVMISSAGNARVDGIVASGTQLRADVAGGLTTMLGGALLADQDINLSATTALSNAGMISTAGVLNFTTPAFSSTGTLESGAAFALTADSIVLSGRLASTNSITLNSTGGVLDLGASLAGTTVALSALGGDLTVRDGVTIDATDTARFTSNRTINFGGSVAANNGLVFSTTGGAINFSAVSDAQTGRALSVSASGAITNGGTLIAGGNIDLNGGSITSGALLSDGAITLGAAGAINVDGTVDAAFNATIDSRSSTITVGTLGSVTSGAALRLTAAGDIVNSGDLITQTTLDATSGTSIINSGLILANTGAVRLGAGRLQLGGDVYAGGILGLSASDITIGGSVVSNAALGLSTGTLNILGGGVLQSNRAIDLSVSGAAQVDGTLRALETLDLSALSLSVGTGGLIEGDGRLGLNVTNALTNAGEIGVTGALTLAAGTLSNSGDIIATAGASLSGGAFTNAGFVGSGGALGITNSSTAVTATGTLQAVGALSINSDSVNNAGIITARDAVDITGRSALTNSNAVVSNTGAVSLTSSGVATIGGTVDAATSVSISGARVALTGDIAANGNVGVTSANGAIDLSGTVNSGGAIGLAANGGDLTVAVPATLFSANGITGSGNAIIIAGNLLSRSAIGLNTGGALGVSGNIISNAGVSLTSGGALSIDRSGNIDAASAALSGATLQLGGTVVATNEIALNATSSATIDGLVSAGRAINFNSSGTANFTVGSAGGLISSGSSITLQNIGAFSVASGGLISGAGDVAVNFSGIGNIAGRVETGQNLTLTAPETGIRFLSEGRGDPAIGALENLQISGSLFAGGNVAINGGTTSVSGRIDALGDFIYNSDSYAVFTNDDNNDLFSSLTVGGQIFAGRDVGIYGAAINTLSGTSVISAGRNFESDTGYVFNLGTLNADGNLRIATDLERVRVNREPNRDFFNGGTIQAQGSVSLSAHTRFSSDLGSRILSNDSVLVSSGNFLNFGGTINAANLISLNASRDITIGGTLQSGRRIAITSGDQISIGGFGGTTRIETSGNATNIGLSRDAGSAANIDIRANNGISVRDVIYSDGSIAIKSNAGVIVNQGTITGLNAIVLQAESAGNFVNNQGTVTAGNLALYQGNDFNNTGSFTANNNLLLSARSITNSGLLGAGGSLILQATGGDVRNNGGTIFAGGEIAIGATGGVVNDLGTILAVGNIGIEASSLLNDSARIESLGGNVSINAANVVNRIKTLQIIPGTGVPTPAGLYDGPNLRFANFTSLSQCGTGSIAGPVGSFIFSCFGNTVEVERVVGGPNGKDTSIVGTFEFRPASDGGDTVGANSGASNIIAAGNVTINAASSLTNSNSNILAGNNIIINTGTLNNVSNAPLSARITAGGTVTINAMQVNNGPGGFGSGGDTRPGIPSMQGANEQGGRGGAGMVADASGTANPNGTAADAANGGAVVDAGAINVNFAGGRAVNDGRVVGNGADMIDAARAAMVGAGDAVQDATAAGAALTGGANAADDAARRNAAVAINLADGSAAADRADGVQAGGGLGANGPGVGGPRGANVNGGGINGGVGAGGNVGTPDGFVNSLINRIAGGAPATDGGVGVGPVDTSGVGGVGSASGPNGLQAGRINGAGAVDPDARTRAAATALGTGAAQLLDGMSIGGGGVGAVTMTIGGTGTGGALQNANGVGTTASDGPSAVASELERANLTSGLAAQISAPGVGGTQTAAITGVEAVDPDAVANAGLTGMAAQTARLVDGFNGLAIPGILGSGGQAGSFVLDFLGQFGLIANGTGFGVAGGGGLFTFNNNPDSQFLFTTNPGFASTADLFDSAFFFDQLGVDRSTRFVRLGDGFFEAQLIGKQVQVATGQAKLGAFGDSFAQARGLLQAGVAEAKRLQLSVGVALTAAQVANLSTSIVWYVKSTVQGRDVLVPVVYLAAADQKSFKGGAIISGTNVVANVAGTITNSGTISASRVVSLTAGGDIVNASGGRIAGGTVVASAARDILAQGGSSITGGNILLSAGRDVRFDATTTTTSTSERKDLGKGRFTQSSSSTQTVTGAELAASGNLVVSAGRDLTLTAARVSAGGDASLSAGRDVNVTGVTTTDTTSASSRTSKKNSSSSSSSTQTFTGTTLTTGGNLSVAAGNILSVTGSDIAAGGNATLTGTNGVQISSALQTSSAESASKTKRKSSTIAETATTNRLSTITAGGNLGVGSSAGNVSVAGADLSATGTTTLVGQNVSVTGVIDSASFNSTTTAKKSGFLSSKKTTTVTSSTSQAVVASTIAGDRVNVVATGGDVSVKGSNIVSDNGTVVQATGNIGIGTLVAKSSESQDVKVKKSGLSFGGGGLFLGVAKTQNASTLETVTNSGSLVGAANGDVTLNAGKALTITGSQVAAPGTVTLTGESVKIENATDTANSTTLAKSSSFGVSIKAQSNVVDAVKTVSRLAEIGSTTSNARVAAVSAVAGGLAIKNGVDAAKDVAGAIKDKNGSLGVTVSASIGFSKSKSTSESTDQTIVASNVAGGDVNIVARGAGTPSSDGAGLGSVSVVGSDVTATNNLTVLGNGPIRFEAARETDTTAGKSSSFGVSLGVSASVGLEKGKLNTGVPSVNFGLSGSKGSFSGTDVTNREATLSAAGTATIGTPGALTLDGAILSAKRVEIDAGSLAIASRQDTSTFQSKDKSAGVNVSVTFAGQVSVSGNLSSGKQSGDFASVQEQAGVRAGEGGFGIRVGGNTDLKGAVIASTADAALNSLTTGTLTASDIANRERFAASSTSIGGGLGNIGQSRTGQTTTDGTGNKPAGLATPLGNLSATPPAALSASGSQSSTTVSAIAAGGITVASGDTASLGVAQSISRDTSAASADAAALLRQPADSALTKQFTDAKRTEIAQGFEATRQLVSEVGTFFANRAADEQKLRDRAADPAATGADGQPLSAQARLDLIADANKLRDTFGAGSAVRIGATALTGAAGSNVTGSIGSLVQGPAVNVLQSLAATEVKKLADSIQGDPATRETVRAALQAVVGCAGASAGGSGGCGSAAVGAAASVVLNNLISAADPWPVDRDGDGTIDPLSVEEVEARRNLVGTLVAAIASGTGLDANAAATAAVIETENNASLIVNGRVIQPVGGRTVSAEEFPAAYRAYLNSLRTSPNLAERQLYQQIVGQFGGSVENATQYRSLDQSVVTALGQAEAIRLVNAGADAAGLTNFANQRSGITPADIALFGGDAGQLNIALQYGYTLDEIRASNGRIPSAFSGNSGENGGSYIYAPDLSTFGRAAIATRLVVADTGSVIVTNFGRGSLFETYVTNPASATGNFIYRYGIGPDTAIGYTIDTLINRPFYAITGLIGQTPLGDPGVIATFETSGIPFGRAAGAGLQGVQELNALNRAVRLATPAAGAADDIVVNLRGTATVATDVRAPLVANNVNVTFGAQRPPLGNFDDILPNPNTRVLSITDARALNTPNRGVIYVQENSSMSQAARDFQSGCTGASCDIASRSDAAPSLRFDNPNPNGNNFVRFDGIEKSVDGQGIVLIDRKTFLFDFKPRSANTIQTFTRVAEAVKQNPGYQVVYEFPNQRILEAANTFIRENGLQGVLTTRVAGSR